MEIRSLYITLLSLSLSHTLTHTHTHTLTCTDVAPETCYGSPSQFVCLSRQFHQGIIIVLPHIMYKTCSCIYV